MSSIFSSDLTNFHEISTNFAYFLLISPIRYSRDHQTGLYSVKTFLPQKFVSALASILSYFWLVAMIRQSMPSNSQRNAANYFAMILNIIGLLMKSATLKIYWLNSKNIVQILNFIVQNSDNLPNSQLLSPISKKLTVIVLCLLYAFTGISNCVTGRGLGHIQDWSPSWWWNGVIREACYNFFLSNATCITLKSSPDWNWTIGIISAIGFYQRHILGLYCELCLLMGVLTLWSCSKSMAGILRQDIQLQSGNNELFTLTQKWLHGYKDQLVASPVVRFKEMGCRQKQYFTLQRLTRLVNQVHGTNMLLFLVDAVLYYSTGFIEVFIEESGNFDVSKIFRIVFFFANTCAIMWYAADVPCQMGNAFKEWMVTEGIKEGIKLDQLHIFVNDLQMNEISLKASEIFPVTFQVIAQLVGVTVTYFVICIQG